VDGGGLAGRGHLTVKRSADRILTTHVGSLPVPSDLTEDGLPQAVKDIVKRQASIGVDVVNDGELSKGNWLAYAASRLGGFEARRVPAGEAVIARGKDREAFSEFYEEATRTGTLFHSSWTSVNVSNWSTHWVATEPIHYVGQREMRRDVANLQAALADVSVVEAFLPVTAPASLEPYRSNEFYPNESAFLYALADAMKEEYEIIARSGLLVQVDDAWTVALWDRMGVAIGLEAFLKRCRERAEVLNHALAGIPEEQIRYHICWGSWHGPHLYDLPLADFMDVLLSVRAGAYLVEAANVRHEHEYHLWERVQLPAGKVLIPGVVTHSTNLIEHPDLVSERIQRYARLVGRENLIAGTDCGMGGRIHPQLAWAKLEALVEGARLASNALW
jgi:5-methyltetrahydropteroyltriglutamate--homocysteine methyltransferase